MPAKPIVKGSKVKVLDAHYDRAVVVALARWTYKGNRKRRGLIKVAFTYRKRKGMRWVPRDLVVRADEAEEKPKQA